MDDYYSDYLPLEKALQPQDSKTLKTTQVALNTCVSYHVTGTFGGSSQVRMGKCL